MPGESKSLSCQVSHNSGTDFLFFYFCCYREFLAPGAHNPVNIDARIAELVRKRMEDNPNRYCFAEAQVSYEVYRNNLKYWDR